MEKGKTPKPLAFVVAKLSIANRAENAEWEGICSDIRLIKETRCGIFSSALIRKRISVFPCSRSTKTKSESKQKNSMIYCSRWNGGSFTVEGKILKIQNVIFRNKANKEMRKSRRKLCWIFMCFSWKWEKIQTGNDMQWLCVYDGGTMFVHFLFLFYIRAVVRLESNEALLL